MFHLNSFLPKSFLPVSWRFDQVSPVVPEGRSGYWRLFFHQLQEEALKPKSEPVKKVETFAPVKVLKDGSAVVELPVKPKARVVPKQVEETAKAPPFRPFLKTLLPITDAKSYVAETMLVYQQVQMLFSEWNISSIMRKQLEDESELDDILLLIA